jgi:hypothetical protein
MICSRKRARNDYRTDDFRINSRTIEVSNYFTAENQYQKQSLAAAITEADILFPNASSNNPAYIRIYPGTYLFTTAIVIKSGIFIITDTSANIYTFVLIAYVPIWFDFQIGSHSGGPWNTIFVTNGLCDTTIRVSGGGGPQLETLILVGAANGNTVFGSPATGVEVSDGSGCALLECIFTGYDTAVKILTSAQTYLYDCVFLGAGDLNFVNPSAVINTGVYCSGPLILNVSASNFNQCTTYGIHIDVDGSPTYIPAVNIQTSNFNGNDTALYIPSGNADIQALACTFVNSITNDVEIISTDASLNILSSTLDTSKIVLPSSNDNVNFQFVDTSVDNTNGLYTFANLVSGDKRYPSTSHFGQGGRSLEGVILLKEDVSGATFTDVSADLLPSAATLVTVFDDLTQDIFYIGDDYIFQSFVCDITTPLSIGSGSIAIEIWDGASWTSVDSNTQQNGRPYSSYADNLFNTIEEEVTRLDVRIGDTLPWATTSVNGSTKYWMRLRVTTTITTSPIIATLYPLYNTTIIDNEGIRSTYGTARAYKTLQFDWNNFRPTGSASTRPSDQDFWFGEFSRLGREYNSFRAAGGDRVGTVFFVPVDMDTSSPIRLIISFASADVTASQVDFELTVTTGHIEIGDVTYFTSAAASGNTIKDQQRTVMTMTPDQTVGTNTALSELEIPLPFVQSRDVAGKPVDVFSLDLERAGGDLNPNSLDIIQITILYLSNTDGTTIT